MMKCCFCPSASTPSWFLFLTCPTALANLFAACAKLGRDGTLVPAKLWRVAQDEEEITMSSIEVFLMMGTLQSRPTIVKGKHMWWCTSASYGNDMVGCGLESKNEQGECGRCLRCQWRRKEGRGRFGQEIKGVSIY